MKFIDLEELEFFQNRIIERTGGSIGIRDKNLLESAINKPFQTFVGTNDNVFKFIYKGNAEDLKKNNSTGKVDFHYGTSLGSTGSTQLLNDTNYYQVKLEYDFIMELTNTTFNGNKFINVQIAYADTTDSIDLAAYMEYKVN